MVEVSDVAGLTTGMLLVRLTLCTSTPTVEPVGVDHKFCDTGRQVMARKVTQHFVRQPIF